MRRLLIIILLVSVFACGKSDPEPTEQERITGILRSTTWKIQKVTIDDVDKTSMYENMTLNFTTGSYTATKGEPVWPSNGTWAFVDESATSIKRNDGLIIDLSGVTENSLQLAFVWNKTTMGDGRSASIAGKHVFTFGK